MKMYPNNDPYGQQFQYGQPQAPFGQGFPPPPPAPAQPPYGQFGQPPTGTRGSGMWPADAASRFAIGTWLMIATTVVALAAAAVPPIAMVALVTSIGMWVYLIAGLVAHAREKKAPRSGFADTGDIVLDTLARIHAMTPADEARMSAMVDAEENEHPYPPNQGF